MSPAAALAKLVQYGPAAIEAAKGAWDALQKLRGKPVRRTERRDPKPMAPIPSSYAHVDDGSGKRRRLP